MPYRVGALYINPMIPEDRVWTEVEVYNLEAAEKSLAVFTYLHDEELTPGERRTVNVWIREAPQSPKGYSVPGEI